MKTNMTERDKKLLVGMFIGVIIVAIGYWGILPQIKRYNALEEKIEKEEEERKINKMKIMNLSMIEIQAEEYEQKIVEKKDEFYQIMKSSEVDRMMTELATGSNLDIYELNFTMPTSPSERMAYQNSALYQWQLQAKSDYENSSSLSSSDSSDPTNDLGLEEDEDDADTKEDSSGSSESSMTVMDDMMVDEGGYQPNTDIYAVPVTMTVGGDLEDLESFIDKIINDDKRTLLVSYSWGSYREIVRRDADGNIIRDTSGSSDTGEYTSDAAGSDETGGVELTDTEGVPATTVEVVNRRSLTVRLEIYMCDTESITQRYEDTESDTESGEVQEQDTEEE